MAYSGNHPRFSAQNFDAKEAYNKDLTASARLHYLENDEHDKGSPARVMDEMHNGVAGVQQADFEQFSSSKSSAVKRKPIMKTNQSGGGMLASDPGAAGRELLYNQTKASGLKKTGKELRKEAKLEKTKKQIKEDPTRNSARSKRKLKKLDKTAKQLGAIKIEAGAKPPVSPPKEVRRAAAKNKGEHKGDY